MKSAVLLFGTFNPITNAHIHIGKIASELVNVDDVIYIPSKDSFLISWKQMGDNVIMPGEIRANLVEEAIKKYGYKVERCEIEEIVDGSTYNTIQYLKKEKNYNTIYLCFGTDKINELDRWSMAEKLISENKFIIIDRAGETFNDVKDTSELVKKYIDNFQALHNTRYTDISSTEIRKAHIEKRLDSVKNYLPENVYEYLNTHEEAFSYE